MKEGNRRVPEFKLQHLSPKDREVLKLVCLSYQDLFKETEVGIISCSSYGYYGIKMGSAASVNKQQ